MQIRELLALQDAIQGGVPSDVWNEETKYESKSRKKEIKLLDMDLVHLVRKLNKIYMEDIR